MKITMDLLDVFFKSVTDKDTDVSFVKDLYESYPDSVYKFAKRVFEDGDFRWHNLCSIQIPKSNGGFRNICPQFNEDKFVASFISYILFRFYGGKISNKCISYKPGFGYFGYLRKINKDRQGLTGYKTDIKSYFDNIPNDKLEELVRSLNLDSVIERLIIDLFSNTIDSSTGECHKGIIQGSPISAYFADLYLSDVDDIMSSKCKVYYRYCDDIIMFGDNIEACKDIFSKLLVSKGLEINPDKCERIEPNGTLIFLGCKVGDILEPKSEWTKDLHKDLRATISNIHCKNSAKEFQKVVMAIQKKLYKGRYSILTYLFNMRVSADYIMELDKYCKQLIRHHFTGCWNYTKNIHKIPEDYIYMVGWINLMDLRSLYYSDRDKYDETIFNIFSGRSMDVK